MDVLEMQDQQWSLQVDYGKNDVEIEYGIGEVAEELDLSLRTIRFYEQKGLINPRRAGRRRIFDAADVERLRFVRDLRSIGVTVREIKVLIGDVEKSRNADAKRAVVKARIERRLGEIREEAEFLKRQEVLAADLLTAEADGVRFRYLDRVA